MCIIIYRFACGTAKFQRSMLRTQQGRVRIIIVYVYYKLDNYKQYKLQVRRFIIAFKAWRNETWGTDGNGRPKSYFLSLLVLISHGRSPQELGPPRRVINHAQWWVTYWVIRLAGQSILRGLGLVNCLSSSCSHYRNRYWPITVQKQCHVTFFAT